MPSDAPAEITARLAAAERLLASGKMVGDAEDHRLWRTSRDLWVAGTVRQLAGVLDEHVMERFQRAVAPPAGRGKVSEDLPADLDAVRQGMAVLIGVRARMAPVAPSAPPDRDRRGRRLGP
jgi:hypothetical protein